MLKKKNLTIIYILYIWELLLDVTYVWLYIEVLFWFISRVQIYGTKKDLSLVDLLNVG
jgi:hypothetical protein